MDQRTMQGRMTTVHEERYQVPLLVALLLLGLEAAIPERRGTRDASESGAGRAAA
jgi:hypothetical protein